MLTYRPPRAGEHSGGERPGAGRGPPETASEEPLDRDEGGTRPSAGARLMRPHRPLCGGEGEEAAALEALQVSSHLLPPSPVRRWTQGRRWREGWKRSQNGSRRSFGRFFSSPSSSYLSGFRVFRGVLKIYLLSEPDEAVPLPRVPTPRPTGLQSPRIPHTAAPAAHNGPLLPGGTRGSVLRAESRAVPRSLCAQAKKNKYGAFFFSPPL